MTTLEPSYTEPEPPPSGRLFSQHRHQVRRQLESTSTPICPRFLGYLKPAWKRCRGANGVRSVMIRRAHFPTGAEAEPSLLQTKMSIVGRLPQDASPRSGSNGHMHGLAYFIERYISSLTYRHQLTFQQLLRSSSDRLIPIPDFDCVSAASRNSYIVPH
jgi:hypothetical protein